jgi:DNA adenine methylase
MNYIDREIVREPSTSNSIVEPFLKWAGGKRWLFRRYRHLFPQDIKRLIDPFVGGGSSFFYLQPHTAILSDLNSDLIDLYCAVRTHPRTLTKRLVHYHHAHSESFFYKARGKKPGDPLKKSAWWLYLNRTCWNGLFRVNLRGEFNVPIGTKKKVFVSIAELDAAAESLKRTTLLASDFEAVIDCAQKGDLIFADPPYFEKASAARFLRYNSSVFSWHDQVRLQAALTRASRRGAICFVTNANHQSLIDLYSTCGTIHRLKRQSVVSGKAKGRRVDQEILVELK